MNVGSVCSGIAADAVNTVVVGDCLDIMQAMPNDSVDLVICSPPYEDARTYSIGFSLKDQAWVDWSVERYIECVRVCKGLVVWVVEGRTKQFCWSATPALLMADLHRAGISLRKPPIYHRVGIPGSGGPDWWRNDYEFIVCASKGKLPWSMPSATGKPCKYAPGGAMSYRHADGQRKNERMSRAAKQRYSHAIEHTKTMRNGTKRSQTYVPPPLANPGNVVHCKVGGGLLGSPIAHENEAPFPESLVLPFVLSFCPPDGIVLDPFCGSGTSLAVAAKNGRRYIGIDQRQSQVDLSKRRLAMVQQELFG